MNRLIVICMTLLCWSSALYGDNIPTNDEIRQDLIGRKVQQVSGGYFGNDWSLDITENNLKNIMIIDKAYGAAGNLMLKLSVIVVHRQVDCEISLEISYRPDKYFGWRADYIRVIDIVPINTGRYDNCIVANVTGMSSERVLELANTSDMPLLVGGVVRYEYQDEWHRFSVIVEPYEKKSIGTWIFASVAEGRINFIVPYL